MVIHGSFDALIIAIKLVLLGVGILYLFRVLWTYHTEGAKKPLRMIWSDPARSADGLAIWLGLKLMDYIWSGLKWGVDVLEEASADIGEWFVGHRGARG